MINKYLFINFKTEYSLSNPYEINAKGYHYLSILTDGYINPENNNITDPFCTLTATPYINKTYCYVKLDNDIININSEIYNISIKHIEKIKYFNYPQSCIVSGVSQLDSGYGNLIFILTDRPLPERFYINKKGIYDSIKNYEIPVLETRKLGYGAILKSIDNHRIKYIPLEYKTAYIGLKSTTSNLSASVCLYPLPTIEGEMFDNSFQPTNLNIGTTYFSVTTINLYSPNFAIEMTNLEVMQTAKVSLSVYLLKN